MKPSQFNYHDPTTIEEATTLLAAYDDAIVMAGNQTLGMEMSYRNVTPDHLIDLNNVSDLSFVRETDEDIVIGAMTRHQTVASSPILQKRLPILTSAAEQIAGPSVRSRGTLGGSLGKAHPAGNYPTALLALEATIHAHSTNERRTLSMEQYLSEGIRDDELIQSTSIPTGRFPTGRSGMTFLELKRAALTWPTLSAGTAVAIDDPLSDDPVITEATVALANAGPGQVKVPAAEKAVIGTTLTEDACTDASDAAISIADPPDENHADSTYKKEMAGEYTRRSLQKSYDRAVASE